MRARAGRLLRRIRSQGAGAALRKAWADHGYRRTESVIVEYRVGSAPLGRNTALPEWLSFLVVEGATPIPPLCDWMAHRAPDFAAMREMGKTGVFAMREDVAIGCAWIAFSDHHDFESREFYAVPPGEAYHYCWMVDPAQRNANVGMPLCRHVVMLLEARGITRAFGVVDLVNRASYLLQYRLGYRECGKKVIHYHALGTRWTRIEDYQGTLFNLRPDRAAA